MAQIPYWKYRQGLREMDDKLTESELRVENVEKHIDMTKLAKRNAELNIEVLSGLDGSRKTYEAVGRMFVLETIPTIQKNLETKIKTADEYIATMEKTKKELEHLVKKDRDNLRKVDEELLKSE